MSEYLEAGLEQIKRAKADTQRAEEAYLRARSVSPRVTPPIRLRHHTDGRVALNMPNAYRLNWYCRNENTPRCHWLTDEEVFGPGWVELFVAELPEPDGHADVVNSDGYDVLTPYWNTSPGCQATAWIDGVSIGDPTDGDMVEDLDRVRAESLKMLAAVAACERYRAERDATTAPPATTPAP